MEVMVVGMSMCVSEWGIASKPTTGQAQSWSMQYVEFHPRLLFTVAQVLNFRSMYIMADLADDAAPAFANERVLVSVKAYPDGSFDMRPGFSKEGCKYRFEDSSGEKTGFTQQGIHWYAITPPSRWHFQVQDATNPSVDAQHSKACLIPLAHDFHSLALPNLQGGSYK